MGTVGDQPVNVSFAPDFSFAETPSGERITFTRSEKRALAALARRPDSVLSRDQILDAVAGAGSDSRDRNIDFLINRLRRKLSDNARHPRFIATRYGEGYAWIGGVRYVDADHSGTVVASGPLRGIDNLAGSRDLAERFASHIYAALNAELAAGERTMPAQDPASGRAPILSVELTFFEDGGAAYCVSMARGFRSRRILAVRRVMVPGEEHVGARQSAAQLAKHLLAEAWRTLAMQTEDGMPLPVLMHLAAAHPVEHRRGALTDGDRQLRRLVALHETRVMAAWKENEARLRHLLEERPADATLKVMYATQIHSKYVQFGYTLFQNGIDDRGRDEDDIEALVLDALPHVQSKPEYAIMAAKLLHFLQRGYSELARDVCEQAYATSTAAAGALAMVGQFRAFTGETEAALRCIDQALNLVTPGSTEHLYAFTIKLQVLHAVSDFERLNAAKRELYSFSAALMLLYEPLFSNPEKLSLRAKAVTMTLSHAKAAALLKWQNYVSARLFGDPAHRMNAILTLSALVTRRFGKSAIPDEVAATHPHLLGRLDRISVSRTR